MQDLFQSQAFFWLFWLLTTAFGILVGWWVRAASHERKWEQMLEIREQERQHLAHQLEKARASCDMKEADLKKTELDLAKLQAQVEAFDRERQLHLAAVESAAQRMAQLKNQTDGFQTQLQVFEEQILGLRTRNAYLTGELNQRREELNTYKNLNLDFIALQKNVTSLEEAIAQIELERNHAQHDLDAAWLEIDNLQTELLQHLHHRRNGRNGTDHLPETATVAPDFPEDDLKIINGVTPFAEQFLKSLGIVSFQQIAHWDADTIEAINDQLGFYNGKIEKENWVAQARHLVSVMHLEP